MTAALRVSSETESLTTTETVLLSRLASARQGLFFVPLIFLLPTWVGGKGVLFVQPIADALTFVLALGFAIYHLHSLKKTEKKH